MVANTNAADRVAAIRDEYARLGEDVTGLSDLELLNEYAERAERERLNTNDRYMRLLTEQRHYGDRVRAAANREFRARLDIIATQVVERQIREAQHLVAAVEALPPQPKPDRVAYVRETASSVKHMLHLLEEGRRERGEWHLDNHYDLVQRARSVVGVLRDKPNVAAQDIIRLLDEALTGDGHLKDLFVVADATPIRRQKPAFAGDGWTEMGGGGYWVFEPDGARHRVVAYNQGDTWWIDLQGPTGALIAAGETGEDQVADTAIALIEQAPELAASGLRPWQCWERATRQLPRSEAMAA